MGGKKVLDIKIIPSIFLSEAYLAINAREACRNKWLHVNVSIIAGSLKSNLDILTNFSTTPQYKI